MLLSPINSDCTKPMRQPRGRDTFLSLANYPFDAWDRKPRRKEPVVELTVRYAVPDIREFVVRVEERGGGTATRLLWERPRASLLFTRARVPREPTGWYFG